MRRTKESPLSKKGRIMDTKNILDIIQKNDKSKGGLISILEEIQEEYTYLPEPQFSLCTMRILSYR